ncbi:unnamed protein product, partial [Callosobruchus maculatus]
MRLKIQWNPCLIHNRSPELNQKNNAQTYVKHIISSIDILLVLSKTFHNVHNCNLEVCGKYRVNLLMLSFTGQWTDDNRSRCSKKWCY